MKTCYSTFLLLLAVSYQSQAKNCIRTALDARQENEPTSFWLARARFFAAESKDYLKQWRQWTALAA